MSVPSAVHPGHAQGAFNHIMERERGMSTRRCRLSWSATSAWDERSTVAHGSSSVREGRKGPSGFKLPFM